MCRSKKIKRPESNGAILSKACPALSFSEARLEEKNFFAASLKEGSSSMTDFAIVNSSAIDGKDIITDELLAKPEHDDVDDRLQIIPPFVSVRTAEMVNKQLTSTAATIYESANRIKETLDQSTATVKGCLENSSEWVINAIKRNTEITSANAKDIEEQIAQLSKALLQASGDFQTASDQSSRLGRRLNGLTAALVFAAILTAGATAFQALETKRQADLNQQLLDRTKVMTDRPTNTPGNGSTPPKK
jgi:Trp operon repressor